MAGSKVVVWNSDEGRLKGFSADVVKVTGKVRSALKVLRDAHAFMAPFVKVLSRDTGDVRITIAIQYEEQDREPAPPLDDSIKEYERCFDPNKRKYPPEPFRPAPNAYVRHATDMPCPTCGVPVNVACDPKYGETYIGTGNGLTVDDGMRCHRTRYDLLQAYANLTNVEQAA